MLKITHNAGFFSCCSVKLDNIINYVNHNNKLPDIVDSSQQFDWYKETNGDITFTYFEHYNKINVDITKLQNIDYYHNKQFEDYNKLDYAAICPYVKKYFSPSTNILNMIDYIEKKYNITNYNDICVLFYRGNDKIRETSLCTYEEIIEKANHVLKLNPNVKFLIQSDETEFIQKIIDTFPLNTFYFKDEIRHMPKNNSTVDKVFRNTNFEFSQLYLAITIIMSKCNYIIFCSGNCSIWIMLYRENSNNMFQYLNGVWL
jgi:hypothetical protein